ncbi:MAG TPA: DUF362 domain-containing protein [Bryobacteraceae bacterium]|nr:DUF362 domain-containing protein [Bryobacteraceae bacterium]
MDFSRRQFLTSAASAAGLARGALAAAVPSPAVAHYKSPAAAPEAIAEEARRLTRAAIGALGGMGRFVSKGNAVWVKPNIGWDRGPEQAACSNPDVVATLVELCYQAGAAKVTVGDNPCVSPENSFARSGIQAAARKAGARCFYMDERKFRRMALHGRILKEWEIYTEAVEADRLINVFIPKQHSLSKATLGMKNLMGLAGGPRNRFHQDIAGALADLAAFLHPQLIVVDAVRVLAANGPTGGNLADVRRRDTVAAGVDQVAMDAFGAALLGLRPEEIGFISEAHSRGLGTMDFRALAPAMLEV